MVEAPLYIDLVLVLVYLLAAASLAVISWSAVRQLHSRGRSISRLSLGVTAAVAIVLLLTWLTASVRPLSVAGKVYDDPFWLRIADMFINTSLLLIIVCSVIVIVAKLRR